jgi:translocation and assembly module TamB
LVHARREQELWNLGLRLTASDPESIAADGSNIGLGGNLVVGMNGAYAARTDRLELAELSVTAPYLQADGSGVIRDLSSQAAVDLKGSLNLDWDRIRKLIAQKIEPNARISGRPRPWRLAGVIDGLPAIDRMGSLEGDIGVQIDSLDIFGMRLSAVPVVLRAANGRLVVDPIDAELNGGVLHLEPELIYDKAGSTWVYLGKSSRLDGAIVNDEVSHRVLSFAAPVLDGATRVEGRVSLALADAYFPILAAPGAQVRIDGDVLFDDVRFMPGPLADQLLSVFQRERRPLAVLRDPVNVRIADRKVYQQGLTIPVAKIASIGLDGSVDFDQNLDLVARFSLQPPRSGVPILTPIMQNARFDLPIRGTLKNPKIDGEALKEHWKEVGVDLLGNSMEAGVNGLQRLLEGLPVPGLRGLLPPVRRMAPPPPAPADPDTEGGRIPDDRDLPGANHEVLKPRDGAGERPAPLTAEERRKMREQRRLDRLQKKADRRLRQNMPPR